jgi:hypothetical protein
MRVILVSVYMHLVQAEHCPRPTPQRAFHPTPNPSSSSHFFFIFLVLLLTSKRFVSCFFQKRLQLQPRNGRLQAPTFSKQEHKTPPPPVELKRRNTQQDSRDELKRLKQSIINQQSKNQIIKGTHKQ